MKKKNLFLSISLLFLGGINASEMARIRAKHLLASHDLGAVTLRHDGMSFHVRQGGALHKVESYDVDPVLRKVNKANLGAFLKAGKIGVVKMSDGSFALHSHIQGLGGGVFGANFGFFAGKFAVHFVGQGLIQVAALCTGPAYGVTLASLEACLLPEIEAFSNVVGCATGIATAVATGPV